jgi:2-polyprenyl-3-methyl-5-hydroxy-6-metoxy-1,4-benzoquinol methylase
VRSGDPWPYADKSVDVIISNQVLEHLFDPALFFREVARCLKLDGISIYLGPFKNVIWEDTFAFHWLTGSQSPPIFARWQRFCSRTVPSGSERWRVRAVKNVSSENALRITSENTRDT